MFRQNAVRQHSRFESLDRLRKNSHELFVIIVRSEYPFGLESATNHVVNVSAQTDARWPTHLSIPLRIDGDIGDFLVCRQDVLANQSDETLP